MSDIQEEQKRLYKRAEENDLKEKNKEYCKKYYYKNIEKSRERSRIYYEKHREEVKARHREYNKKYYKKNKEQLNAYNKNYRQEKQKKLIELQNRINKAIEYIEKYCEDYVVEDSPDEMCLFYGEDGRYKPEAKQELLDILKGDNK